MSTNLVPEDDPFAYGDRTVLQLRSQPFQVQDELGTVMMMTPALSAAPPTTHPVPLDNVFAGEDAMARLERKLDTVLRQIEALEQRIASLDLTLARVLAR